MKKIISFISVLTITVSMTNVLATTKPKVVPKPKTTTIKSSIKKTVKKSTKPAKKTTTTKKTPVVKGKTYGSTGFTTKTITTKVKGKTVKQNTKVAKIVTKAPNGKIISRNITCPTQSKAKAKVTTIKPTLKQVELAKAPKTVAQPTKSDPKAVVVVKAPPKSIWCEAIGFNGELKKRSPYYYFPKNPNIPKILYTTPFKGPKYLDNNTWVQRQGSGRVIEWTEQVALYMHTMYNVDYRTYNKTKYVNNSQFGFISDNDSNNKSLVKTITDTNYLDALKRFFMPNTNWAKDESDNKYYPVLDCLKYWNDNIKNKQIIIKSEFITDPSLMYCSSCYGNAGGMIVRGQLNFTVLHCKDMKWLNKFRNIFKDVKMGKKYSCVVDIEMEYMSGLYHGWTFLPNYITGENAVLKTIEVK